MLVAGAVEEQLIDAAIRQFTADLKGCISLIAAEPSDGSFKVKITPMKEDGYVHRHVSVRVCVASAPYVQ